MTMGRENRLVGIRHPVHQGGDHVVIFIGHHIAHRIGNVDGGGTGSDGSFHGLAQIVNRRAGCIHAGPFDILNQIAGLGHRFCDDLQHLLLGLLHLVGEMNRRG